MNWTARLQGHSFDLDRLTNLFREGEPTIWTDESGYYLRSSTFEDVEDVGEVKERADRLLRDVNGIARALDPSYRPVGLTSQFKTDDGRETTVIGLATADERDQARAVGVVIGPDDQKPAPPPPPGPKYMALVSSDANVAKAIAYLESGLDARRLRLAYEVIRQDVGGEKALREKGWASRNDLAAFRAPLHREDVGGDEALHAGSKGDRPARTMNLSQARRFLHDLLVVWMDSKLQQD